MRLGIAVAFGSLLGCRTTSAPPLPVDRPPDATRPPARIRAPEGATVIEDVSVVPMDRTGVLDHHSVVVDKGRIIAVAPAGRVEAPESATRIDGRGKFLLPGLADMHAHAVDDEDLFLYLAAGVTQLRATFAVPQVLAQRDRVARGEVIGPSIHVEGQITDGVPPVWGFSFGVASEADVDKVIAFHVDNELPAMKVYERLTLANYDLLVAKGKKAGLRIIGHVPEQVGLAHVLESGQSSIEHLDGYSVYLAPKDSYASMRRYWQSNPVDFAGFIASFESVEDSRLEEAANLTRKAGTWNCPTLVLFDHYMRSETSAERNKFRGARYLAPHKKSHWDPKGFPVARAPGPYEFERMRKARPKILAVARALDGAGAGLLVGTDSGNAGIVPGYSALDEIELLVEAGLTPWHALRAATSGAAAFLGQSREWGSIAVGQRADLLLLRGNPLEDIKNLGLRDGVIVRGRWFPASELDGELAKMEAYNTGTRSRLAETPPPPVDGARELLARYRMVHSGEYGGEQRLVIDRRADGTRVIIGEILAGAGPERVRVEVGDGHGALIHHESGGGVLELVRDKGRLRASFTPLGGAPPVSATFDLPRTTYLSAVTLAPDQLFYPAAMKLKPGGQVTVQLVQVVAGSKLTLERSIVRLLRRPDRAAGLRTFSLAVTVRNQTFKGELVLDETGRLVEQDVFGERTRRAD